MLTRRPKSWQTSWDVKSLTYASGTGVLNREIRGTMAGWLDKKVDRRMAS